jgi:hypothetical protein
VRNEKHVRTLDELTPGYSKETTMKLEYIQKIMVILTAKALFHHRVRETAAFFISWRASKQN